MVLPDNFAIVDGPDTGRKLVELDFGGAVRTSIDLDPLAPDIRAIGTGAGPAAVWIDNGKIVLQMIRRDGSHGKRDTFGKKATVLCDGTASNDARFGVGWIESDGRIWFVHGPVAQDEMEAAGDDDAPKPKWCGIASADDDIALLWPDGKKLMMNICDRRRCSGSVTTIKIDPAQLRGFGCTFDDCLFATADGKLTSFTMKGKQRWTRDVPGIRAGDRVSIVGSKDRFAVGYHRADGGASIARVGSAGTVAEIWNDPRGDQAPALALSKDRLAVGYRRDHDLQHIVIKLL
jgi:hypothetical protein